MTTVHCERIAHVICRKYGALYLLEDATQEALIALWKAEQAFDSEKGDNLWYARKRVVGAVIDFLRKHHFTGRQDYCPDLRAFISIDDIREGFTDARVIPTTEPVNVDFIDLERMIGRMLDGLIPRHREFVEKRFLEEKTQAVVAAEMGFTFGRSSQMERKVIERMREMVA